MFHLGVLDIWLAGCQTPKHMTVDELETLLEKHHTTKTELASAMGYADTSAVSKWFERRHIPRHTQELVKQFFTKRKKTRVDSRNSN